MWLGKYKKSIEELIEIASKQTKKPVEKLMEKYKSREERKARAKKERKIIEEKANKIQEKNSS